MDLNRNISFTSRVIAPGSSGGVKREFSNWMWFDGTLRPAGFVQNNRTFGTYMWADNRLWTGGLVNNSGSF